MLNAVLVFPPCQYYVYDVFLLLNFSVGLWSVSHRLREDEQWTVAEEIVVLFGDEVICSQAHPCCLIKPFLQHLYLRIELLSQVEEDLLLAESVTVDMELEVGIAPSML